MSLIIAGYGFEQGGSDGANLEHARGVYAVLCEFGDGHRSVIDVGESEDVRDRVENHDRRDCWRQNCTGTLGIAVYYTPGWSTVERRTLVQKIRAEFDPPCGEP